MEKYTPKIYTIEQLQGMMADLLLSQKETDKQFKETDKQFKETDKQFKETDKKFKEIFGELGGIGKSNGEIAEDFFSTALEQNMQVGKLKFDYIDFNLRRKRKNTEAEYDIILYNNFKVLIIEVKYFFKMHHLQTFYSERIKKFRTLFPEYSEYKVYGGVAALSYDKNVIQEAKNYGFYILKQNNDKIKIANKKDFVPNNIK